jgi:hypothetical protein
MEDLGTDDGKDVRALASRYMAFVNHAYNGALGRFRNFMSYSRQWTEECGSEDSHGRALWALGTVVGRSNDPRRHSLGGLLFHAALPGVVGFTSPRAWAYALLGIDEYLRAFEGDSSVQSVRRTIAERLLDLLHRSSTADWPWFEDRVTYSNARLSQALIVAGASMGHEEMTAVGLRSLDWLMSIQVSPDGYFAPVGSNGFYLRGQPKPSFDQQPIEACATIAACLAAERVTLDARWGRQARSAFGWFFGQNHLQESLYDPETGGCRDGLHADRANQNQGAESTLSFLLALVEMRSADTARCAKSSRDVTAVHAPSDARAGALVAGPPETRS